MAGLDLRAARIAVLQEREGVYHCRSGDAVEPWEHAAFAQDTDIVERRLYGFKHFAHYRFSSVDRVPFDMSL